MMPCVWQRRSRLLEEPFKIDGFVTFIQSLKSKAESYTVVNFWKK